jgi:hypothetical protein
MKTAKLTGAALDWAAAKCEYFPVRNGFDDNCPEYSTDWAQGGPIIERELIETNRGGSYAEHFWKATRNSIIAYGPTPLIAAMRCYVTSKLGNEIELPEDLNKE